MSRKPKRPAAGAGGAREAAARPDTIASLLNIHPRFMRSAHLERDIQDPEASLGYILTPLASQTLERILVGLSENSTQRAWRITGDYGSGKTDFGLVLSRVVAGKKGEIPKPVQGFIGKKRLQPLVATGNTEPLTQTILRALGVPQGKGRATADAVMDALAGAITKARRRGFEGILLLVDELGKNLEYAARHPETDDVFLLQRLAEEAARSGARPFVLVTILHQGVAAYAKDLDGAAQREWGKVAGRFEEVLYAQQIEQMVALVAATLGVDPATVPTQFREQANSAMAGAIRAGMYGPNPPDFLSQAGPQLFPLHPAVLPLLIRLMRRFGQNERSLFSFISSGEPMALQQHAERTLGDGCLYRACDLFDYARLNLLSTITAGSTHTSWGVIEGVLGSAPCDNKDEEEVLKTAALFALLDSPDLPATEEVLCLAACGGDEQRRPPILEAIGALKRKGILYERGASSGLCLWPHTSVDLDAAFRAGISATDAPGHEVARLCEHAQLEPLVLRTHYVQTGTLRYADVKLVPGDKVADLLADPPKIGGKGADIFVRIVFPRDKKDEKGVLALLRDNHAKLPDGVFLAVADPPTTALPVLADLLAWDWVIHNTPQLSGDRFARQEASRQLRRAEELLRVRLNGLANLARHGADPMEWFSKGEALRLPSGRRLMQFLSEQCSRIYDKAPRIFNEMINRRCPSSTAVAARLRLLDAMVANPSAEHLAMDPQKRPPEMALYLSILKSGGFHVETGDGWAFRVPEGSADKHRILPVFEVITRTLRSAGDDALVPVTAILDDMTMPPFGVREGLHALILALYLATHHQHVALYEDGTFLHAAGGDVFQRLWKEPQAFHLQYCALEGVRMEVFHRLMRALDISQPAAQTDLIDLVRPLAVFVAKEIPQYCRATRNLSASAIAVRTSLLEAREPGKLVFSMLPKACGLPPVGERGFSGEEYAQRLRAAIQEIRGAQQMLFQRLESALFAAFDLGRDTRSDLAGRAAKVAKSVTEPTLRAFALRLADPKLEDRPWLTSVANLLTHKSPENWSDLDEAEFHHQLDLMAGRFRRVEAALGMAGHNGDSCRVALTRTDGAERLELLGWKDDSDIAPLAQRISALIQDHGRKGVAAAARALWAALEASGKTEE